MVDDRAALVSPQEGVVGGAQQVGGGLEPHALVIDADADQIVADDEPRQVAVDEQAWT